jgi:hypothetical protein
LNNKLVTETIRYDTEWVYNSSTGRTESKTTPTRVVQIVRSPLLNLADDLETQRDKRNRYEKVNFDIRERPGYEILGMVAFLLATALRIVKTSIELFGNLKKQ